jgi:hypothetical protein
MYIFWLDHGQLHAKMQLYRGPQAGIEATALQFRYSAESANQLSQRVHFTSINLKAIAIIARQLDLRPYSKSTLTLNEWRFNLSFSCVCVNAVFKKLEG